jgi:uncharacterized membrane protein
MDGIMTITTSSKSRRIENDFFFPPSSRTSLAATVLGGTLLLAVGLTRRGWLRAALASGGAYLVYRGIVNDLAAQQGKVRVAFTIQRSPEEVFDYVRQAENWPRFLQGIDMESGPGNCLKLTLGRQADLNLASEAEITDEKPGEYIAWHSWPGPLQHRGVIRFRRAPADRGTEISVALEYRAPAGPVARALASLVGWDPEQLIRENLRHLKQLLEAGELPTTAGQSFGSRGVKGAALRVLYREGPAEDATERVSLTGD